MYIISGTEICLYWTPWSHPLVPCAYTLHWPWAGLFVFGELIEFPACLGLLGQSMIINLSCEQKPLRDLQTCRPADLNLQTNAARHKGTGTTATEDGALAIRRRHGQPLLSQSGKADDDGICECDRRTSSPDPYPNPISKCLFSRPCPSLSFLVQPKLQELTSTQPVLARPCLVEPPLENSQRCGVGTGTGTGDERARYG